VALGEGVARNYGIRKALEHEQSVKPFMPDQPRITGALGVALIAIEKIAFSSSFACRMLPALANMMREYLQSIQGELPNHTAQHTD